MLGEEDKRCHAAAFLSMDRRARCGGYFTPADLSKNTAEQRPLQSCGNDTRGTGGDTQSLWYERKVLV